MTDTASRIRHIPKNSWDHVDVKMKDGLAGCFTAVDTNVEAVCAKVRLNRKTSNVDCLCKGETFF